jgi:hypothetical protein
MSAAKAGIAAMERSAKVIASKTCDQQADFVSLLGGEGIVRGIFFIVLLGIDGSIAPQSIPRDGIFMR